MIDSRFYKFCGPFTADHLINDGGCNLQSGLETTVIQGVSSLDNAKEGDCVLLHNPAYLDVAKKTNASVVIAHASMAASLPSNKTILSSLEPLKVFSHFLMKAYEEKTDISPVFSTKCNAFISTAALLAEGVKVGPGAVIEAGVKIGQNTIIGAGSFVGFGCMIGEDCVIEPQVSIQKTLLGKRVYIKSGARLGQPGFGFNIDPNNPEERTVQPQLGRVLIGDHVHIGSNTTIDRGSLRDTVLENCVRIDNLVQVAHNVHLEKGVVAAAQVGLSGSVRVGKSVLLGGQVGVSGHLHIGDGARVAAQSGLLQSVSPGQSVAGTPAVGRFAWHKQHIVLQRMIKRKGVKR